MPELFAVFLATTALLAPAQTLPGSEEAKNQSKPGTWSAAGTNGAVAAGGQEAVHAGLALLKAGGNAADGAAATILALSVTDSTAFCFGGEVPILVYDAKRGTVEVLCGLGTAPRLATRERFKGGIPGKGVEPAAVPGVLDACLTMLERHGTKTFADAVAPTLGLLDAGNKPWHADLAVTLRRLVEAEKAGGDRRRGLRLVADYFYRGPVAREIDAWSRANGGLIRYPDLATHTTRVEEPAVAEYRGHRVYKCGVWTQGPYLLQALQLLDGFDVKGLGHNTAEGVHVAAEAMKLALADRDVYYADPHFADVPATALLSPKYAELRRGLVDRRSASRAQRPGDPAAGKALLEKFDPRVGTGGPANDTTTCVVADGMGNVVAATPSGFGGVVAGETGVTLGTRLQSFNNWPGHANCIEPGKRPRITLTPTLVLKGGKPALAVSVAGGDMQDQATLQLLVNAIDFGMPPERAVTAARFGTNHHLGSFRQTAPQLGSLLLDPGYEKSVATDLEGRGHAVSVKRPAASPVMIRLDPKAGRIEAAGDPKARRHAGAY
ncbi:MAG: gamma-glutamyltransferase family protein [Gemmataceae bacterium]